MVFLCRWRPLFFVTFCVYKRYMRFLKTVFVTVCRSLMKTVFVTVRFFFVTLCVDKRYMRFLKTVFATVYSSRMIFSRFWNFFDDYTLPSSGTVRAKLTFLIFTHFRMSTPHKLILSNFSILYRCNSLFRFKKILSFCVSNIVFTEKWIFVVEKR